MTTANSPSDNDSDDSKEYDENIVNVLEELQKKIIAGQPIQPETIYQQFPQFEQELRELLPVMLVADVSGGYFRLVECEEGTLDTAPARTARSRGSQPLIRVLPAVCSAPPPACPCASTDDGVAVGCEVCARGSLWARVGPWQAIPQGKIRALQGPACC